jgi:hypothetical protein
MDIGPIIAFSLARLRSLEGVITATEDAKNPVFGYLFAGKKLREIARRLSNECKIKDCDKPQQDLPKLKLWRNNLHKIRDHLASFSLEAEFECAVVLIGGKLVGIGDEPLVPEPILYASRRIDEAMRLTTSLLRQAFETVEPDLLVVPLCAPGDAAGEALLERHRARRVIHLNRRIMVRVE